MGSRDEGSVVASGGTAMPTGGSTSETNPHAMEVAEVARQLGVEPELGLSATEAAERLRSHGPNKIAGGKKESGFQAFVRQYQDLMQIVLLGGGRHQPARHPTTSARPSCWSGSPCSTP